MSLDSPQMNEFLSLARGTKAPDKPKPKPKLPTQVSGVKKDDLAAIRKSKVVPTPSKPGGPKVVTKTKASSGAPETQPPPRLPDPDKKSPNDHPEETPSVEPGPEAKPGGEEDAAAPEEETPAEDAAPGEELPEGELSSGEQRVKAAAKDLRAAKETGDEAAIEKARRALIDSLKNVGKSG